MLISSALTRSRPPTRSIRATHPTCLMTHTPTPMCRMTHAHVSPPLPTSAPGDASKTHGWEPPRIYLCARAPPITHTSHMRSINPLVMHQWLALAEPHGSRLRAPLGGSARNDPSLRATDHAHGDYTLHSEPSRCRSILGRQPSRTSKELPTIPPILASTLLDYTSRVNNML